MDELDLLNGFADVMIPFGEHVSATPRGGPQKLIFGSQRLVGPGDFYYVWPDARFCKCLYVGNEARFRLCERLGFEQKLQRERHTAEMENEAASLLGGAWGLR